jgi:hypothetical protein
VSDETKCEVCENTGRRRRGTLAPAEGFHAEILCNDEPFIFWVCSAACRDRAVRWQTGPGKLDLDKCPKCDAPMPGRLCPKCGFDAWGADTPGPVVAEIDSLRARLAEVERERDALRETMQSAERYRDLAVARLANANEREAREERAAFAERAAREKAEATCVEMHKWSMVDWWDAMNFHAGKRCRACNYVEAKGHSLKCPFRSDAGSALLAELHALRAENERLKADAMPSDIEPTSALARWKALRARVALLEAVREAAEALDAMWSRPDPVWPPGPTRALWIALRAALDAVKT